MKEFIVLDKIEKTKDEFIEFNVPSSKSLSIRALILASIADGKSIIKNVLKSQDTEDCLNALKSLGVRIEKINQNDYEIYGCNSCFDIKDDKIYFGSSGITSRFLLAILVASLSKNKKQYEITLDGSNQLRKRSIKDLVDALKSIGGDIKYLKEDGYFPILVKSKKLNDNAKIKISGELSSQFVSAILMMSPLLENKTLVEVQGIDSLEHPYVKMALKTMKDFGIDNCFEVNKNLYEIYSNNYKSRNFIVETDLNTASYFLSIASALNQKIIIKNVEKNSLQPALKFIDLLKNMSCKIEFKENNLIFYGIDKLIGGFEIDMFYMAELSILLAVLGVFADKPIKIYGIKHIRNHESNRITAISNELKKAGIDVEEFEDGLIVKNGEPKFIEGETYEDHRIAMSLSLLGIAGNGIKILNPDCVSKTCPEFFDLLKKFY